MRHKTYNHTALGKVVVDYLAYKETLGRSPATIDAKESFLSRLALMYPTKGISDLTSEDVLHFIRRLPARSHRLCGTHLNDFFNFGIRWDHIMVNPMIKVGQFQRPGKKVFDVFLEPEIQALCGLPLPDGGLARALLEAGLRRGEALRLQPRHLLPDGFMRVVGKGSGGGKERLVPMTSALERALAEVTLVEGLNPKDYFWYDKPGGRAIRHSRQVADRGFVRWWNRVTEEADVRYRNPHMCRHTFATNWLRDGGRLEILSLVMGHASIATTFDLYGHLDMRDVAADMRQIQKNRASDLRGDPTAPSEVNTNSYEDGPQKDKTPAQGD